MTTRISTGQLRRLAQLYGVQTAYYDVNHRRQTASAESLLAGLRALGADLSGPQDAAQALREKRLALWRSPLEPVAVAWDGNLARLPVRLPHAQATATLTCRLTLEDGGQRTWQVSCRDLPALEETEVAGERYVVKGLPFPQNIPWGYHKLELEIPGLSAAASLIIAAPTRAYDSLETGTHRDWGVFLPLYALRRKCRAGASGDFTDLQALGQWVNSLGGNIIATLPLLTAFLDQPFEPSPYAPASRLLWNEFYVDLSRAPELPHCPEAQSVLDSAAYLQELERLRRSPQVDYRAGMALKRRALEKLARCCFARPASHRQALETFVASHPVVEDYARFRGVMEQRGGSWHSWPERMRGGSLRDDDCSAESRQYHLYAQWLAHQQVRDISQQGHNGNVRLYLDLPLGVHGDGYDAWRWQELFVSGMAAGAPPDAFFTKGQNWGFPPLNPQRLRESGYAYYISYLRHHLEAASLLRIDHVMGLHRLFCLPEGMDGTQGMYLRYPAEELYAILCLESHRNRAAIVGEDLGTVPPQVRPAMQRHGLHRMYVVYFEVTDNPARALNGVPANALASINTHDMPPLAAFWQGNDIQQRRELGYQNRASAAKERRERETIKEALVSFLESKGLIKGESDGLEAVLRAVLLWLGQSPAPMVLVNLEDLWLETQPQNIPGTGPERPNWRQRARYSFEEFSQLPGVVEMLQGLNDSRKLPSHHRR